MSTQKNNEYLLIFRSADWYRGIPPEEMRQIVGRWMDWFNGLKEQGVAAAGSPLEHTGGTVSGRNGRVIKDGPFAESKETIGGYFLLKLNTLDEAVAVAQGCPGLPYGIRVEARPVAGECPLATNLEAGLQT